MRTMFTLALIGLFGAAASPAARAEEHEGPHKGIVVEWGEEEYHGEIVVDAKAGAVTVYIYGDDKSLMKGKGVAIAAKVLTLTIKGEKPVTIKLEPAPVKGDPEGTASQYTGKHEIFTKEGKLTGTLSAKIGTKPYSGDFKQK